jgi:flavin-dependent dehydrogenase
MCADAIHGDEQYDVVILGAGTAGVSCALECFDIQLDTVVFEAQAKPGRRPRSSVRGSASRIPWCVSTSQNDGSRSVRRASEPEHW